MATANVILGDSIVAEADLSAKQYTLVKMSGTGGLVSASAATDQAFILSDNPKLGVHGTIALVGIEKCVAGGTIAAGAPVTSDASGHVVAAATGNHIVGQAMRAAVANDLVPIRVGFGTF